MSMVWSLLNAFYVVFQEANSFHTPGAVVASSVSMTPQQQVGNVVTSQTMPGILVTAPPPTVTFVQAFPTSLATTDQPYQVLPLKRSLSVSLPGCLSRCYCCACCCHWWILKSPLASAIFFNCKDFFSWKMGIKYRVNAPLPPRKFLIRHLFL